MGCHFLLISRTQCRPVPYEPGKRASAFKLYTRGVFPKQRVPMA